MKTKISNPCSQRRAGRYLLNRMTEAEETLFQQHLEDCEACRSYVDSVRRLSGLVAGELPAYAGTSAIRKPARLWTFASIAASILLAVGFSVYVFSDGGGADHRTSVNHRTLGDREEMDAELIFPGQPADTLRAGELPAFRWNREAAYELVLRSGSQTLLKAKGNGRAYTPDAGSIKGYRALDWVLTLDGKPFNGTLYFNN
jgi:hypothetical protein